ncbi:putative diaminopimelate decarboxylase (DAP decarboxylase) (Meso-2,6-diaminoheptanedioate carboxy-lyase) [Deinococcus deserti VCD115]|uniref:Putative diaminopimelate decarboxylase (DAP decarboxylase) (Meso-2,6-diaminoheptanedioate carboxy-lyase) n=1 Tax=Deinococcus deserti (strain DSM 17065 / CIP 109153 / LMG 22923 / VCD115) TaxID=546414 RepID=C1CZG9_DEIDV|nr:putative diaminopimelate decarboxylase (DAP decarboxylase) (Meso-2,6-diaminoheptanedioate carboxy-lyase) [Deinococcus deserti VCD115]
MRAAALKLAATTPEPISAYVYDLAALDEHAAWLRATLPAACELFYAVKANPEPRILETLAPHVDGFEVASGGELAQVSARFPQVPVIFGGPGKTDSELAQALEAGAEVLHVESRSELERLAWTARSRGRVAAVLLRVNLRVGDLPDTPLTMGGRPTPFGIDAAEIPGCLAWLEQHPELQLRGFHFHLLSHQLDARAHLRLLAAYAEQVRAWQSRYGLTTDLLNVGGGIGVNYRNPAQSFDWSTFCTGMQALTATLPGVRWRLELGRFVTAGCGYYAMQVIDLKHNLGEAFVVARGGTHQFRTPAAQGHNHPFEVLAVDSWPHAYSRVELAGGLVTVVGQLCTPKDVLARRVPVGRVRAGDLLLFSLAGAYAWNISHQQFLSHPAPQMVFLAVDQGGPVQQEGTRREELC